MSLHPDLYQRLQIVGVDPDHFGDPEMAWERLHKRYGRRATLIDRYELEAAHRAVGADELGQQLRARLTAEVLRAHDPEWRLVTGSERSRRDPVEVVSYDPSWSVRFDEWRNRLRQSLGSVARRIETSARRLCPAWMQNPCSTSR